MKVIGIETSCDETAVALLECDATAPPVILHEEISSQIDLHKLYGGVVPELASREHLRNLPVLVDRVWKNCGVKPTDLGLIAVTQGPGLKGCLLMGLSFAKGLALQTGVPLVGVNHIEGHIVAPQLDSPELNFPYLALVVSGGHTEIVEVQQFGQYRIHARTIDDASGEAFDKSAHLLGFEYPGGPQLAGLADSCQASRFSLPRVMRNSDDFSFSGLKTAIGLLVKQASKMPEYSELRAELAWTIQESIVTTLLEKLRRVMEETDCRRVVVTGGVSANRRLRSAISSIEEAEIYYPNMNHCMDNGAMIAWAGWLRYYNGARLLPSAGVHSRWPVETITNMEQGTE